MSGEEKPPEQIDAESTASSSDEGPDRGENSPNPTGNSPESEQATSGDVMEQPSDSPVLAELADGDVGDVLGGINDDQIVDAQIAGNSGAVLALTPTPISSNLDNLSANGGAVGSFVLGIWCVIGSLITNWSMLNGFLGIPLGVWGLTSRKKKTAWVGIALCFLGALMCIVQVSELVSTYLNAFDENEF